MKRVISARLRHLNLRWLLHQTFKFMAVPLAQRFMNGEALAGPLMGGIFVTYRCNSNCGMCTLSSRHSSGELTENEIIGVIDDMMAIGVSGIGFTGGEPLLRDDIFRLIRHVRRQGLPVTLNTNAILLSDTKTVAQLVDSGVSNVNISLDSASEQIHDKIRGRAGAFRMTLEGMKLLASAVSEAGANISITAVTVISNDNLGELENIARVAADAGAHQIGFMPLHLFDHGSIRVATLHAGSGLLQRLENIGHNILSLENSAEYLGLLEDACAGAPFPSRCNAGYTSIFVDPFGKVAACLGYFQTGCWHGDLRSGDTISALWRSEDYKVLRRATMQCRSCYLNCQAELNLLWPKWLR